MLGVLVLTVATLTIGGPAPTLTTELRADDLGATLHVELAYTSRAQQPDEVVVPLVLPPGASVIGAAITTGTSPRVEATLVAADTARADYQRLYERRLDPLLVESDGSTLRVRGFPLAAATPLRIELDLDVSGLDRLRVIATGAKPREVSIPTTPRPLTSIATVASRGRVAHGLSLYAGYDPPRRGRPTIIVDPPRVMISRESVGAKEIRRKVKDYRAQLGYCYARVTQYQGGAEGTLMLRFVIATNGSVAFAEIDGDLGDPRITQCLRDIVIRWEFSPGETPVVANYPLTFTLRRA